MPAYTDLSYPTLHGQIVRPSGLPATGRVLVSVYATVQDPTNQRVLGLQPDVIELVDGEFTSPVPASAAGPAPLVELTLLLDDAPPEVLVFSVVTTEETVELADLPGVVSVFGSGVLVIWWRP